MRVRYGKPKRFRTRSKELLAHCISILNEYEAMGYQLTLRGLYYQLVGRGILEEEGNNDKAYKMIGRLIKNAREGGLISWLAIHDRTRSLKQLYKVKDPTEALADTVQQYNIDLWQNQPYRIEIWVEKDALLNVVSKIANKYDIPYFSCRGYSSASETWLAGFKRFRGYIEKGNQTPLVLQLSDLDPSGVDMFRDVETRLSKYSGYDIMVKRLGLTIEQVQQYNLPPNPAKLSDTRAGDFIALYGNKSYELDALAPDVIANEIEFAINEVRDVTLWNEAIQVREAGRERLSTILAKYKRQYGHE